MSRYLGIDVGEKRVGLAVSDLTKKIATPYAVVDRDCVIEKVKEIIDEKEIEKVIIGKSLDLKGDRNKIMDDIEFITSELKKDIDVELVDEKYSTIEAGKILEGTDDRAAAIILQRYLDKFIEDDDIDFTM